MTGNIFIWNALLKTIGDVIFVKESELLAKKWDVEIVEPMMLKMKMKLIMTHPTKDPMKNARAQMWFASFSWSYFV